MDTPFPFGFPAPTAFYLTLFVVTLLVHIVLMNYVLAGAGLLAVSGLRGRLRQPGVLVDILADWLPFALGGAITAAIAPLLFVQILYRQPFYTANLLLFHRWMAMLPVLIVGFYLLYLVKAPRFAGRFAQIPAAVGAALCFLFAAWSWTENSLLTLAGDQWAKFYEQERIVHWEPALLPRVLMFVCGALPTMALICTWQIANSNRTNRNLANRHGDQAVSAAATTLARLAIAGLLLAMLAGGIYAGIGGESVHAALRGPVGRWYFVIALLAAGGQLALWWPIARGGPVQRLGLLTLAVLVTIGGMTVVREAIRLHTLDAHSSLVPLFPQHAEAAGMAGFGAFLFFAVVNVGAVATCVWIIRTGRKPAD